MQTRPYPSKDGRRIWLSRDERAELLAGLDDEPRRWIALSLGLHGLRTDEIVQTAPEHVRSLANGADGYVLVVPDGKTGKRELPIATNLADRIRMLKNATRMRADEPLVDVGKRQVRNWLEDARKPLLGRDAAAAELGMHDLRRTWATDTYYSLAFEGVPIAETLTMSWGGWKQTESGRSTFRENYLGPVPDHVTDQARKFLTVL